ncbi:hypothetical protein RGQ29_010251 [Quercus rubra]|uniref:Uncharacterized protein n=1 Tax=Quercus rubra TaxID=3512 RepID=A0AAN7FUI4_QUERU|nr:hypothetical protein RGQ29_010251 [Quercus rubra]
MVIAILFAGIGVLLVIICCFWRKFSLLKSINFGRRNTGSSRGKSLVLQN